MGEGFKEKTLELKIYDKIPTETFFFFFFDNRARHLTKLLAAVGDAEFYIHKKILTETWTVSKNNNINKKT